MNQCGAVYTVQTSNVERLKVEARLDEAEARAVVLQSELERYKTSPDGSAEFSSSERAVGLLSNPAQNQLDAAMVEIEANRRQLAHHEGTIASLQTASSARAAPPPSSKGQRGEAASSSQADREIEQVSE